jgi:outer membrane protein
MFFRTKLTQLMLSIIAAFASFGLMAQQEIALDQDLRPLWEAGAFVGVFHSPVYPAAAQRQTNIIPSPYFIYRGETVRLGEGSIARAVAVDTSWYELDLSLAGSFSANSDDNPARAGMPDLDFIFELGPQLRVQLKEIEFEHQGKGELFLNLQTRAAFSTDFSRLDHRGYVFQPELSYRQRGWFSEKTALSLSISPTWATQRLHDYFYQVDADFVNNERPAYDAKGGYLGTDLSLGMSFNARENIRVFVGGTVSIHAGAANEDSPLFREKSTYSIGMGVVWRLWESEERVAGR